MRRGDIQRYGADVRLVLQRRQRHFRDEGDAHVVHRHLYQCVQARFAEAVRADVVAEFADVHNVVFEAVAFAEQQQRALPQLFGGDFFLFAQRVVLVNDDVEALLAKFKGVQSRRVVRQGDDGGVEHAVMHRADEALAHVFADVQLEIGVGVADDRQRARQQVRRDGRDEADRHREVQCFLPGVGVLNQLLRVKVDLLGAAQQLFADGGNDDLFVVALKDDDAEVFFHFGDAKREGGL